MIPFIDLQAQYRRIGPQINARIQQVLDHGQFIMGPEVYELEEKLAAYVGVKHALAVSSGTDALLIALMGLGVGPGDEVIVPDFTFFATASMATFLGAKPISVDIDPRTYTMDPNELKQVITKRTKAIIPVGLYGQCADMDAINQIADAAQIPVIEDACQSFGAIYKGKKSGALSQVGCTSFFPSKPLGCYGDGGAIFTDDDELAELMKSIRIHGHKGHKYYHVVQGLNGRMDTMQAAVLLEKLSIFDEELAQRQVIAQRYNDILSSKFAVPYVPDYSKSAWAQYTIEVDNREQVMEKAEGAGIPTMVHYPKLLSEQEFLKQFEMKTGKHALAASRRVMSLPMGPYLTKEQQQEIGRHLMQ